MKIKTLMALFALVTTFATANAAQANLTVVDGQNRARTKLVTPISLNFMTPVGMPFGRDWDVCGLQTGLYNEVEDFCGLQIGIANVTEYFAGWQIGVVNVTRKMRGVQLGLVNVIRDCDVPFLPILNWAF